MENLPELKVCLNLLNLKGDPSTDIKNVHFLRQLYKYAATAKRFSTIIKKAILRVKHQKMQFIVFEK